MNTQPSATLATLLQHLGFTATIEEKTIEDGLLLDIHTEEAGRLIGRQGQTLSDLQYILNRLLFQQDQNAPRVTLDVGGYRSQARAALIQRAKDAAEKVRRFGDIVELEPLNSFERRIVHQAVKDDPDIETHSVEVEGSDRKVIVFRPKRS